MIHDNEQTVQTGNVNPIVIHMCTACYCRFNIHTLLGHINLNLIGILTPSTPLAPPNRQLCLVEFAHVVESSCLFTYLASDLQILSDRLKKLISSVEHRVQTRSRTTATLHLRDSRRRCSIQRGRQILYHSDRHLRKASITKVGEQ